MSKASLFKYYIRIIKAVQYDSEKGLITWLDLLKKQVPEISTQVKELLNLFNDNSLLGLNNSELKEFFDGLEGADEDFLKFIDTVDSSKDVINQYQQYLIKTGKSTSTFTAFTQKASVAIKSLGAAMASMAINWVIGKVIDVAATLIDDYIHKVEKARERTSELFDEFKQMNDTLTEHKKTVAELADRYGELSRGINLSNNKNITLSTEEYEEFLDINKQLADSFPELKKGIDENGNSILTLGTNGITAKEELEKLLQTEEELNNFRIAQDLGDAFEGVYTYVEDAKNATNEFKNLVNDTNKSANKLQNIAENGIRLNGEYEQLLIEGSYKNEADLDYIDALTHSVNEFWDALDPERRSTLSNNFGIDNLSLLRQEFDGNTDTLKLYAKTYDLTSEEIEELEKIIQRNVKIANKTFTDSMGDQSQSFQDRIQQGKNAWRDFMPNFISGMKSKQTFKDLDADLQDIVVQIVEGLDYSYAEAMNEYNPSDPYAYIRDKFIVPMGEISEDDKKKVKRAFTELMTLDPRDFSDTNREAITELVETIATILEKDPLEIKIALGFEDKDFLKKYEEVKKKGAEKFSGVTSQTYGNNADADLYYDEVWEDLDAFAKENAINTEDKIAFLNKCIEESKTLKEAIDKYLASPFMEPDALTFNDIFAFKNIDGTLTDLGKISESIDTIQKAYNTLSSAIDEYNNNGVISIDTLQSVMELGDNWLDYLVAEDGALKLDKESLDELAKSRLEEMRIRTLNNLIDQVKQIENNAHANNYLISTNYAATESFEEVARASAIATSELLKAKVASGDLSQGFYDAVIEKMYSDINKINTLFNNASTDLSYKSSSAASSAAKSFTDLLDKELNVLDKKMEAGYIDFNDYIKARLALIEDYYKQGKIKVDEYYSYLEKHYKQELSYKDKVIKAVTRRIDKEIDKLEKQKDDIESYYKVQIDALTKQKTLLQDANKERQRQIDLQKAMYELERARNQRTKLIYSKDKGMHYVADEQSIRSAQQEAENAEFEIKIAEIEKAITKLEEARDKETDAIDAMIDKLKEYRDQWNDITSAYEEAQEDLIAQQMLGRDWEKDILDTRLDTLNKFKDDYIKIQQAMVDATYQAAQAIAKAESVKIGDSSGGSNNGGNNPKHGWEVVDEAHPTSEGKKFSTKEEADGYAKELNKKKAKANGINVNRDENEWIRKFEGSNIPGYYVKKYHTGLKQGLVDKHSFDDDFKLVQEVGLGDKEVPAVLKEGEAVATPEQVSNLADGLRRSEKETTNSFTIDKPIVTADGHTLRPIQPGDRAWELQKAFEPFVDKILRGEMDIISNAVFEGQKQMERWTKEITNNTAINNVVNNRNVQPVVNQNVIINCPNVTNNSGVENIQKELSTLSLKALQVNW